MKEIMGIMQEEELQDEDTMKDQFLTFYLGNECYAIEIQYVTEIIGFQTITEIPEIPEYIRGIINLRGKIIPVMDVRIRFGKQPSIYNDRTCVVVIDSRQYSIGLIVDSVSEVLSIPEDQIVEPPQMNRSAKSRFVKHIGKIGKEVKMIIDCDELLAEQDMESLKQDEM